MNNILGTPMEFIENSIQIGIQISQARDRGETRHIEDFSQFDNDLKNIYFVGQGLCLDVKDPIGTLDVITLSWDRETFGYFSGGPRRLLSLKALRSLRQLMDLNGIQYESKPILE
jgi:hypothetical protein